MSTRINGRPVYMFRFYEINATANPAEGCCISLPPPHLYGMIFLRFKQFATKVQLRKMRSEKIMARRHKSVRTRRGSRGQVHPCVCARGYSSSIVRMLGGLATMRGRRASAFRRKRRDCSFSLSPKEIGLLVADLPAGENTKCTAAEKIAAQAV